MNKSFKWTRQYDDFLRANHGKSANVLIAECIGCELFALEMRIKYLKLIV